MLPLAAMGAELAICNIAFGVNVDSLGGTAADVNFQRSYDIVHSANAARFFAPAWKLQKLFRAGAEGRLAPHVAVVNA